jgi:hypothetical protein
MSNNMKKNVSSKNGHRHLAVETQKHNGNQRGLGRFPLKVQVLLVAWVFVSTASAACLLWAHHKSWLLAMLAWLGSFIWQARMTVAELVLELWVFILRVLGRKE